MFEKCNTCFFIMIAPVANESMQSLAANHVYWSFKNVSIANSVDPDHTAPRGAV